jgi:hypothetical protein
LRRSHHAHSALLFADPVPAVRVTTTTRKISVGFHRINIAPYGDIVGHFANLSHDFFQNYR